MIKEFCDICQTEVIGKDIELSFSEKWFHGDYDEGVTHYRLKMELCEMYNGEIKDHLYCCYKCMYKFIDKYRHEVAS